ncbi:MAG: glycosyltransferase family 2 protein [Erysipelotrichaceae bacterium]|nr:glycosyltransferase family 2 protein [Erysipelotrichaceae bacterium]
MNEDILISVIVPVYNTESFVERCIASIQNNTYSNLEIICVNDGSTDLSIKKLNELASQDRRIMIIDKENGGVSSARNYALNISSGKYVCFIDSDDWIHKDYFRVLLNAIEVSNSDVVICHHKEMTTMDHFDTNRQIKSMKIKEVSLEKINSIGYYRNSVCGRIYRRQIINDSRFPKMIQWGEDTIFNLMISSKQSVKYSIISEVMYFYYRGNSNSLVKNKSLDSALLRCKWLIENIEKFHNPDYVILLIYKDILFYRYECSFCKNYNDVLNNVNIVTKNINGLLCKCKGISAQKKILLIFFLIFPMFYRLQLIIKDRSYIKFEETIKNNYCNLEVRRWSDL